MRFIMQKNGIVVLGAIFVDIKGFPLDAYIPDGRNAGHIEYIHGGVSRNVVEDIANLHLCPTFLSIVDDTAIGKDVMDHLQKKNVNTKYMKSLPNGMGTWLAVFDHNGDVAGSISQRPDLMPILSILEEKGNEIISGCDSVVAEIDMDEKIIEKVIELCKQYNKKLFGVVSNMNIAQERRELLQDFDCVICNQLEAGILFSDDYSYLKPEKMKLVLEKQIKAAHMKSMVVTMGDKGAVYATTSTSGFIKARKVQVKDTTGAGDAFCAGVATGLTYKKSLAESVEIGTRLAASVITSTKNVCPTYRHEEFGIE